MFLSIKWYILWMASTTLLSTLLAYVFARYAGREKNDVRLLTAYVFFLMTAVFLGFAVFLYVPYQGAPTDDSYLSLFGYIFGWIIFSLLVYYLFPLKNNDARWKRCYSSVFLPQEIHWVHIGCILWLLWEIFINPGCHDWPRMIVIAIFIRFMSSRMRYSRHSSDDRELLWENDKAFLRKISTTLRSFFRTRN